MRTERVVTVDFLRGLLAIGVLFFHTLSFEGGPLLMPLGRHGVYAFFVISGFALYINYRDKLSSPEHVRSYLMARFWRIAPLYYTAMLLTMLLFGVDGIPLSKLWFNATLLLGFANPGEMSMVTGGWSIGVEMVFYTLMPVVIGVCGGKLARLAALTLLMLMGQIVFAHHVLAGTNLVDAWNAYTQPITFAGYFASGCILAECYRRAPAWKGSWVSLAASLAALSAFSLVPWNSNEAILTGWTGVALTASTIALVSGVAFLPEPDGHLRTFAEWIGRLSYGIYLLHPIVYFLIAKVQMSSLHIPATLVVTLIAAEIVNRVIERPAMKLSKKSRWSAA